MKVRRIAGALGADVTGIDLAEPLSDAAVADLRGAWLEHLVLFFLAQDLSLAQFLGLAERFGEPMDYPFLKGLDGFSEITTVAKLETETANFGGVWHSDTTYLATPPSATLLIAREVPPFGGDTLFANQYLAYESLSLGLRAVLGGLRGVSSSAKADVTRTREDRLRDNARDGGNREYVAVHPAVRTHPETGRKSLFVNPAHTVRFDGMTAEESTPLLDTLFRHQVKPEFTCRFAWQPGSLALWDNRCTLHLPINDYHGFRRVMHRITLAGDLPR